MSFTDQKPFIVTKKIINQPWGGRSNGKHFKCHMCGHKFKIGDIVRWVFTNDIEGAGGNPLVCKNCDGTNEQVREKWKFMNMEFNLMKSKWWWFFKHK